MENKTIVRPFEKTDFGALSDVYKSAFAEPPWNEYMKCKECGINYGKSDIIEEITSDSVGKEWKYLTAIRPIKDVNEIRWGDLIQLYGCKKCNIDIQPIIERISAETYARTSPNLVPYWSTEDIKKDLDFAQSQNQPLILVAEKENKLIGFTWGYKTPLEKFPFLEGIISSNSNYMDEIAVSGDSRIKGIGTTICQEYIKTCAEQGIEEIVLRTDERNTASMALFKKQGFKPLIKNRYAVYDPEYPQRIYLFLEVK
jgi:ribosomal protein S18 acetylase RimI-like enzyme